MTGLTARPAHIQSSIWEEKSQGITNIRVQIAESKAYVDYDGPETVLDEVAGIVKKIGYEARVIETGG